MVSEIFHILTIAGALIGSGLFIHLISRKNNLPAKLLALYTLVVSITLLEPLYSVVPSEYATFLEIAMACSALSLGPSLFLYCKYKLKDRQYWKRIDLLHFLPALIMTLLMIASEKNEHKTDDPQEAIFYVLFIIQLIGYTLRSLIQVSKNVCSKKSIKMKMQHAFLKYLVLTSLALFIYSPVTSLLQFHERHTFSLIIQILLLIIITVIALLNSESLDNHKPETSVA